MKTGRRIISLFACFVFVMLTGLLCVSCKNNSADTPEVAVSEPEANILLTFENLGVEDAEYIGIRTLDDDTSGEMRLYHSDSTGMDYYFCADNGVLASAEYESMEMADAYRVQIYGEQAISAKQRKEAALQFAKACVESIQVGELDIMLKPNVDYTFYQYSVKEYYDGLQTGTEVQLYYTLDGALYRCSVTQGSIFEKDADGNVVLTKGDDLIGEEKAREIARDAVLAKLEEADWNYTIFEEETKCEMKTWKDSLFYEVVLRTGYLESDPGYKEAGGWQRTFGVQIDVYDGTVLEVYFSQ